MRSVQPRSRTVLFLVSGGMGKISSRFSIDGRSCDVLKFRKDPFRDVDEIGSEKATFTKKEGHAIGRQPI